MESRLRALLAAAALSFSCPLPALAQQSPVLPISNAVEIDLLACDWTPGPGVVRHQDGLSRAETLDRVRDGIEWWRAELQERGRDINIRETTVDAGTQSPRHGGRYRSDLSQACRNIAAGRLRPDAVQVIVTFPPNELFGRAGDVVLDAGRAPSTLSSATVSHELGHGLSLAHTGARVVSGAYHVNQPALSSSSSRGGRQLALLRPVTQSTYDLVWQDNSGQIVVWSMRGRDRLAALEIARPPGNPNWVAVGVGDLDSGGDDDILFQNGRDLSVWSVDSSKINFDEPIFGRSYFSIQAPNGQALAPIDADMAALGDLNGDGSDDVLWRTRPGPGTPLNTYFPWSLQEAYVQRGSDPNDRTELFDLTRTADYASSFAADIDGDGRDEIGTVLNNGDVRITVLQPQPGRDLTIERSRTLTTLEPGWTLIGAVDANADGFDDLVLRRSRELRLIMTRDGEIVSTDTISTRVAASYRFVGAGRVLTLRQDDPRFNPNTLAYIPEEYGDFTDIMGPNTLRLGAFNLEKLGLLDTTRVSSPSPERPAQEGSLICDPAAGYDLPAVYRYRLPGRDGPGARPRLPSYLLIEYATIAQGRREPTIAMVGEVAAVVNSTGNVIASRDDRSAIFRQAGHALLATDERNPGAQAGVIQPGSRDLPLPIGMDFGDVRVDITLPTGEPVINPATGQPVRDPVSGRSVADAGACAVVRIRPPCEAGLVARSDLKGDFACVTRERRRSFEQEAGPASQGQSTSLDGSRCNAGFVWRQATPEDRACVTAASAQLARSENETPRSTAAAYDFDGYHTCQSNYRWRMADRFDTVCVSSAEVGRVMLENASAPQGRCPAGLVWREAYASDRVCVPSARREQVRADNLDAANRRHYQTD